MTEAANNLLTKMVEAFDNGHENYFDIDFYIGIPSAVLRELEDADMIASLNNITGAIKLTLAGYKAAKK